MVAGIADDVNTSQWAVLSWACAQGTYLPSPTHAAVLLYLCANAFYEADNPEDAPRGQVLYGASYYAAIRAGTGIRADNTVAKVLNDLQDRAYVKRSRRKGEGHQPLRIQVLWDQSMDDYRARLRCGQEGLLPGLLERPQARRRNAEVIPLRQVEEAT